jgi:D-alanine-D-alanine ligase
MKITVLTHVEHEGDREYDVVVGQVAAALKESGHKVSVLGVHGELGKLFGGLRRRRPDLLFNLMETFGDTQLGAVGVAGCLDLVGLPYTGGGPGEFYIQEDKGLAKKLLAFDHIRYPEFAVFSPDADLETAGSLRLPLFVKPLRMDASIGIDAGSLVHSTREMLERVALIHEKVRDAALVEEYVEGREFYVGVLGNQEAQAFPPIEMDFSGLPDGAPHVLGSRAKWDEGSTEYRGTRAVLADVAPEVAARLRHAALDACRALRVRDYGRVDLRLTPAGDVYVIEVNASCYLERESEFALAAASAGMDYVALIDRIAHLALDRHQRGTGEPSPVRRRRRRARSS